MKYLFIIGVVLLGAIGFLIEAAIYFQDPWELLDPLVQYKVAGYFFSSPLVWCILPPTILFLILYVRKNR